jgi:hypothetical protein
MKVNIYHDLVLDFCGSCLHKSKCTSSRALDNVVVQDLRIGCLCCLPKAHSLHGCCTCGNYGMPVTIAL